jgi:hypothetical protein
MKRHLPNPALLGYLAGASSALVCPLWEIGHPAAALIFALEAFVLFLAALQRVDDIRKGGVKSVMNERRPNEQLRTDLGVS